MIENIDSLWVIITGSIAGIGSILAWLKRKKTNDAKDISQNRKDTKINDVDGDAALINQLDSLLLKVTSLSEVIIKIQTELSIVKDRELSYKSAFHRILLLCDEVCTDTVFCKQTINKILEDLKLK